MPQGPAPILLTRPRAASEAFARELLGAFEKPPVVVISPVMEIEDVGEVPDLTPYPTLILTSANAARRVSDGGGRRAYCVGAETAAAARMAGLDPVEAGPDAPALAHAVVAAGPVGRALHLRGLEASGNLAATLRDAGLDVDEAVVYRQVDRRLSEEARQLLLEERPTVVPVFSPRSARRMALSVPDGATPPIVVAISQAAAAAWLAEATDKVLAQRPERGAMLAAVVSAAISDSPC